MTSAQLLAGIGNGLFTLAMVVVSLRLLALWRRTRQTPELAIGAAFGAISLFGFPLMGLSGIASPEGAGPNLWLLGSGLAFVAAGFFCCQVFTWRVFRPDSAWAAALTWGSLAAAVLIGVGSVHSVANAPTGVPPVLAAANWWMALRLLFEVWYVWTGVESLSEWSRARRRMALGLSEPLAVDRFFLWGAMGAYLAANNAFAILLEQRGLSPVTDSLPALVLAANGVGAGALILLTFMPPAWYRSYVRRRAAAPA